MDLPCFPQFAPLDLSFKEALHPSLSQIPDGVSEYTFSNLFLFRRRYLYQVSIIPDCTVIITGEYEGKKFFMTPYAVPERDALMELFRANHNWKCIPETVYESRRDDLEKWGVEINEDRDNFDYLYLRTDLAELSGKKYHKKRNHVNAFLAEYPNHREERMTLERMPDALKALDRWHEDKGAEGDYGPAREALEFFGALPLEGFLYYVDDEPVGWCLGESLAGGRMFAIHFEKGIDAYRGIYQYINQSFAASLPEGYSLLNWEQDLGDEGLRQSKMTYRPTGFVRKYVGKLP